MCLAIVCTMLRHQVHATPFGIAWSRANAPCTHAYLLRLLQTSSTRTDACRPSCPYHNSTHAADVLQALVFLLSEDNIAAHFEPLEIAAALTAAVIHDVCHPGTSNQFLAASLVRPSRGATFGCAAAALSTCAGHACHQGPCAHMIHMRAVMQCCLQDQLSRLFGPSATSETMSIAVCLEILAQDEFNFLYQQPSSEQQVLSTCALPCLRLHSSWAAQ